MYRLNNRTALLLVIPAFLMGSMSTFAGGAKGVVTMTIDQDALAKMYNNDPDNPGLGTSSEVGQRFMWVEDFIDATYNYSDIGPEFPNPTEGYNSLPAPVVMKFPVNGPYMPWAFERGSYTYYVGLHQHISTDFAYDTDPGVNSGKIGISGAFRMRSDKWPGYLLPKDMSIRFDPAFRQRSYPEQSGWFLETNEYYFNTRRLFDITEVEISSVNGFLKLKGNLRAADEWGNTFLHAQTGYQLGSIEINPDEQANLPDVTNVSFDAGSNRVHIRDLIVGRKGFIDKRYEVSLKYLGGKSFGIESVKETGNNRIDQEAILDLDKMEVEIHRIKLFGQYYKANLKLNPDLSAELINLESVQFNF